MKAPWTPEQVAHLNEFQRSGIVHPFMCGNNHVEGGSRVLVATLKGWICTCCDYTQDWAHEFMLDGLMLKSQREAIEALKPKQPDESRLFDLVRWARGMLHDAGLITAAEYAALAVGGGGSESARRLEGYDAIRKAIDELVTTSCGFPIVEDRVQVLETVGKMVRRLRGEASQNRHRIEMLLEVLGTAARKFREYEQLHAAKPDAEKAARNAVMAKMCEDAIARKEFLNTAFLATPEEAQNEGGDANGAQ